MRYEGQYGDDQLMADIAATGKTAPRVTPDQIDEKIVETRYWQPDGTTMTVCLLTLENGFHVIGESAAASAENFDAEIGRKLAFDSARSRIWALEGYLLRQRLHEQEPQNDQSSAAVSFGDGGSGTDDVAGS